MRLADSPQLACVVSLGKVLMSVWGYGSHAMGPLSICVEQTEDAEIRGWQGHFRDRKPEDKESQELTERWSQMWFSGEVERQDLCPMEICT
jgi:hypothetical protein